MKPALPAEVAAPDAIANTQSRKEKVDIQIELTDDLSLMLPHRITERCE